MAIFSDSLFQANMGTQFETPHESMYMAGGGWGADSAYMSPSYMANFRPDYGGPVGFSPNNIPPFSTVGAIGAASALSSSPYYVNPLAYRSAAVDQLSTAPADAAMWGMQNIAAPLAAISLGSALSSMRMPSFTPVTGAQRFAGGVMAGGAMAPRMASAWWKTNISGTMSPDQFARYKAGAMRVGVEAAKRQSLGAFAGATFGRGAGYAAGKVGGAAAGGAAGFAGRLLGMNTSVLGTAASAAGYGGRGLALAGGAVGAAAGSLFMPFMFASGIMEGVNSGVFDPYIATRRGSQAAAAGFANEFTGSSPFGTLGLSRQRSSDIGTALAQAGTEDRAFGIEGQINIFDMANKAGMMSDVGNMDPEQIKKTVKNISRQVQAIMAIAGDPDVSRAIQRLAEMKKMGISGADANTTIQALGAAEAISGTSSLKIQNTIGTQASYLFQQAGLSGQGSMQAAASAYAGFANANKMGLINPTMMAMMGGAEGATQSFLTGQIGLGRSLYNQIGLANRFMFGGAQSGVLGNLGAFGAGVANNPLAAMGALRMNAGVMTGAQLQENPLAPTQGIFDLMDILPGQLTRGKGGKHRWDAFSAIALSQGLSEDQVRAQLELMRSFSDPGSVGRMRMATAAKSREQYAALLERQGIDFTGEGFIGSTMGAAHQVSLAGSRYQRIMSGGFGAIGSWAGNIADRATSKMYSYLTGARGSAGIFSDKEFNRILETGKGTKSAFRFDNDASSGWSKTASLLESMEDAINTGAVKSSELKEIMSLPMSDRIAGLKNRFGMTTSQAIEISRMAPTGSFQSTDVEVDYNSAIAQAYNSSRTSTFVSRKDGGAGLVADSGGKKYSEGLTKEDRVLHYSLASIASTNPESLTEILNNKSENQAAKAALAKLANVENTDKALSGFIDELINDPDKAPDIFGDMVKVLGKDSNMRNLVGEIGGDFNKISDPKAFAKAKRDAHIRSERLARLGISSTNIYTADDLSKLTNLEQGIYSQQEQFDKMANMGQLDFSGYMEATNANKMSLSTDKFSRAVDLFVRAVEVDTDTKISGQISEKGAE